MCLVEQLFRLSFVAASAVGREKTCQKATLPVGFSRRLEPFLAQRHVDATLLILLVVGLVVGGSRGLALWQVARSGVAENWADERKAAAAGDRTNCDRSGAIQSAFARRLRVQRSDERDPLAKMALVTAGKRCCPEPQGRGSAGSERVARTSRCRELESRAGGASRQGWAGI